MNGERSIEVGRPGEVGRPLGVEPAAARRTWWYDVTQDGLRHSSPEADHAERGGSKGGSKDALPSGDGTPRRRGLSRLDLRDRMALLVGLAVAATVAVVAGVALAATNVVLNRAIDPQLLEQAKASASTFQRTAPNQVQVNNFGQPIQLVSDQGDIYRSNVSVVLPVDDNDIAVARGQVDHRLHDVTVDGIRYRVATVPVPQSELRRPSAVQFARPMSDVENTVRDLGLVLLAVGVLGIVGSAWLGRLIARASLKPVDAVAAAAEEVARNQDLSALIPVIGSDEISRLAASLNSMLRALEASRARQRQLVDDASHELRTPLTSLRTNVELLMRAEAAHRQLPAADREALLRDVDGQMRELSGLVTELVELARDEVVVEEQELADLAEVVSAAVERVRRRANPKGVVIELEARPCTVECRPMLLERAVTNLLDNAVKFSPPSATVRVGVADGEVTVADEGPGVASEDRGKIFDRFYRATAARGMPGSGLGLAIVADAARMHGGTVEVADAPGGGALLRFRVPVVSGTSPWAPPPGAAQSNGGVGEDRPRDA